MKTVNVAFADVPVKKLKEHPRNPRRGDVERIKESIDENGFYGAVVAQKSTGFILAGNHRFKAAVASGAKTVPCHWVDVDDQAALKILLADNRTSDIAGYDEEALAQMLGELLDSGELRGTGYDAGAVGELFKKLGVRKEGLTDPDDAPPLGDVAVSSLGDVWILADHRIVCGDCTDAGTVEKCLGESRPHLMVTDPPYGVNYDAAQARSTSVAVGKVLNDDRADWEEAWRHFRGSVAYVWHSALQSGVVMQSLLNAKLVPRAQVVWVKPRAVIGRGNYNWQHEPCLVAEVEVVEHETAAYAVRKGSNARWHGGHNQSTVWFIEHIKSETGHSTQKPVECMRRPVENNSEPGDQVYEPFSGSGTTIIACEQTGRKCMAIELDPLYVDMAVRRWQNFTGKQAVRESDGKTFDELAA